MNNSLSPVAEYIINFMYILKLAALNYFLEIDSKCPHVLFGKMSWDPLFWLKNNNEHNDYIHCTVI